MKFSVIIILIFLVFSCNSNGKRNRSKENSDEVNKDIAIKGLGLPQGLLDSTTYEKIFDQLKFDTGKSYTNLFPEAQSSLTEILSFEGSIHDNKYHLYRINYFYDQCWSPIDLFVLESDTTLVDHFTIDCSNCGCEALSVFESGFINDSTISVVKNYQEMSIDSFLPINKTTLLFTVHSNGEVSKQIID